MKDAIGVSLFQVHPILPLKPKISHQNLTSNASSFFVEDAQFLSFGLACLYPEVTARSKIETRRSFGD